MNYKRKSVKTGSIRTVSIPEMWETIKNIFSETSFIIRSSRLYGRCKGALENLYRQRWYVFNRWFREIKIDSPPVFIVGCGHSGTTILQAILSSHSRIYAVPYESEVAVHFDAQQFDNILNKFDKWAVSAGKHRWVEKTPKHVRYIDKILERCPDAQILLVIRDGRDVAHSIRQRIGSLSKGIQRWVEDNNTGKKYWDHPNVHKVRYEDLIVDFESTIKNVLNFLGEAYEEEMKEFYKITRKWYSRKITRPKTSPHGINFGQYRNWQINQPIFDGRGKWKELTEKEITQVYEEAGDMLLELGYIKNEDQDFCKQV